MTTDDLYLLVAEMRCEHGHLILDDAEPKALLLACQRALSWAVGRSAPL